MTPEVTKSLQVEHDGATIHVSIPSDMGDTQLAVSRFGNMDLYLRIYSPTTRGPLFDLRFGTSYGEGAFPGIAEELQNILNTASNPMRQPETQHEPYEPERHGQTTVTAQKGREPGQPQYMVQGIPDDESYKPIGFLDIIVEENGDVTLTHRDLKVRTAAQATFKSAQNGGTYPFVAEAFTRIAQSITNTLDPTPQS